MEWQKYMYTAAIQKSLYFSSSFTWNNNKALCLATCSLKLVVTKCLKHLFSNKFDRNRPLSLTVCVDRGLHSLFRQIRSSLAKGKVSMIVSLSSLPLKTEFPGRWNGDTASPACLFWLKVIHHYPSLPVVVTAVCLLPSPPLFKCSALLWYLKPSMFECHWYK